MCLFKSFLPTFICVVYPLFLFCLIFRTVLHRAMHRTCAIELDECALGIKAQCFAMIVLVLCAILLRFWLLYDWRILFAA